MPQKYKFQRSEYLAEGEKSNRNDEFTENRQRNCLKYELYSMDLAHKDVSDEVSMINVHVEERVNTLKKEGIAKQFKQ